MTTKYCFMPRREPGTARTCNDSCMAYNPDTDDCYLLEATVALTDRMRRKEPFRHQAPPDIGGRR